MNLSAPVVVALFFASASGASAQTPSPQGGGTGTDVYHVHLAKAAPGQAAALARELSTPDPTAPMPDHFVVLRHQEGDDWDYAVIQHLGQKPTIAVPAAVPASADLRAWHTDTFVVGPSWADFTRAMGIGESSKPGAVYVLGFHRAVPGHRTQLEQALNQPAPDSKIETGTLFMRHLEGSDWQFMTITRYNSWQDFGTDRAAAAAASASTPGGWADIRQHSAFHRDTIADRIHPAK